MFGIFVASSCISRLDGVLEAFGGCVQIVALSLVIESSVVLLVLFVKLVSLYMV